jgi:histidinol-phosphatase
MSTPALKDLLEVAIDAAYAAGRRTLAYFNNGTPVDWKSDNTPVTQADREAESLIRAKIVRHYPDHSILGEEEGTVTGHPDYKWVIDPIDGTKSFIHGAPLYGVMIGVEIKGHSRVGVIYLPGTDEMVAAAEGMGCTWNGRRARVSSVNSLSEATLLVGSPFRSVTDLPAFQTLVDKTRLNRGWGDCYAYAMVATGRAEIAVDTRMAPWDAGPLPVILSEAGGRFSDFKNNVSIYSNHGFATNGLLHKPVLDILSR